MIYSTTIITKLKTISDNKIEIIDEEANVIPFSGLYVSNNNFIVMYNSTLFNFYMKYLFNDIYEISIELILSIRVDKLNEKFILKVDFGYYATEYEINIKDIYNISQYKYSEQYPWYYLHDNNIHCIVPVDNCECLCVTYFNGKVESRFMLKESVIFDVLCKFYIKEQCDDKYSKIKYNTRKSNKNKINNKMNKMIIELENLNLGSRKKKTKKNFNKKIRTLHIKPHSGVELNSQYIIEIIEKISGVYLLKYKDKPLFLMLSSLLLLFRDSITLTTYNYFKLLISNIKNLQYTLSDFVVWLKKIVVNVEAFKHNKYAKHMVIMISKMFSYILCPSIKDFFSGIIENYIWRNIYNFFLEGDFISSILYSATYLSNAIEVYIKTGSLHGFVSTESIEDKISQELCEIRNDFILYKTGDLEYIKGCKQYAFLEKLYNMHDTLVKLKKAKRGLDEKIILEWLKEVDKMITVCVQMDAHTKSRMQPFLFLMTSGTGISKSALINLLTQQVLRANNIPSDPQYIYYLSQSNPYQSGWKNYKTCIICDDAGAIKVDKTSVRGVDLADFILRFSNNVPHELLGAAIEDKGTLFNNALVGAFSSNFYHLFLDETANNQSAMERRFKLKIVARVKDNYIKDNVEGTSTQIDYSKLSEEDRNSIAPDAWLFDCYYTEVSSNIRHPKLSYRHENVREYDDDWKWELYRDNNGNLMQNISLEELSRFITELSIQHFEEQRRVLDISEKTFSKDEYCEHGLVKRFKCVKCDKLRLFQNFPHRELLQYRLNLCREIRQNEPVQPPTTVYVTYNKSIRMKLKPPRFIDDDVPLEYIECQDGIDLDEMISEHMYVEEESNSRVYLSIINDLIDKGSIKNIASKLYTSIFILKDTKTCINNFIDMLSGWFDEMICDVIRYVCSKLVSCLEKFLLDPGEYIPSLCEGNVLGSYLHSKRKKYRVPIFLDYIDYYIKAIQLKTFALITRSNNLSIIQPSFNNLDKVRNEFCKKDYSKYNPISIQEFYLKAGSYISEQESILKEINPDFIRDGLIPAGAVLLITTQFIPRLVHNVNKLYCVSQMGRDIPPEEISKLDSTQAHKWYLQSKELVRPMNDINCKVGYEDMENNISKNLLYCKCLENNTITNCFSPCNKFIIITKHYVEKNMDLNLEFTKGEISSNSDCTNRKFQIHLTESIVKYMSGDLVLIYVPKLMEHSRTKDLINYFPNDPLQSTGCGKLYWKNKYGLVETIDAKNIMYREDLNNENVHNLSQVKNFFSGHSYLCNSYDGLCGAVLLDHSSKFGHIVGLHVGGNVENGVGVSCFVTKQDLQNAIDSFMPYGIVKHMGGFPNSYGVSLVSNDIYKKSPLLDTVSRFDCVEVLGSINKRISLDNKIVHTKIEGDVKEAFNLNISWTSPPFVFEGDKRHGVRSVIRKYSSRAKCFNTHILSRAYTDYLECIKSRISETNYDFFILDDFQVVNGVSGKRFLGGMNMSTSVGKALNGSKSKYATQDVNGSWKFDEIIMDDFHEKDNMIRNNINPMEIYFMFLKLEATINTKAEEGKNRAFFAGNCTNQMLIRKYLLTTCRFWCINGGTTECAVGVNAHSTDWDLLLKEVKGFKRCKFVAADFKAFDLTVPFEVMQYAIKILLFPVRQNPELSHEDLNAINVIEHCLLYPFCDLNGDLVTLPGIIPSGTNVTSILGCIVNSLYYRIAFFDIYPNVTSFQNCVKLRTFGDDSIAGVRSSYPDFSVKNILSTWDKYGIRGTDMHKNINSKIKFVKLSELEFLKRKFVYMDDFGCFVGPLDKRSMFKCLCAHVPPKSMSLDAITGQCVDNFLLEAKFHGRKFYEESRNKLKNICKKHDLIRFTNTLEVTYDEALLYWRKQNGFNVVITNNYLLDKWSNFRQALDIYLSQTWFGWTQNTNKNNLIKDQNQSVVKLGAVPDRTQITKQSGEEKEQVLSFYQEKEFEKLDIGGSLPDQRIDDTDCDIKNFLKRPIKIASYLWGNVSFGETLDPWTEFWTNKRVANRISNFHLYRSKLHIKVVVNGNGFYYGRLMVSYLPFAYIDQRNNISSLTPETRVTASQLPHIFIDPTMSQGGEMILPFFYPADYVRITSGASDKSLGLLYFRQMAPLKHATRQLVTGDEISVTVYAWAEDVDLKGPTHVNANGITPQSGEEKEDVSKPISQACTTIANAAKIMSKIPIIKPYAKSVEVGFNMASGVASALGFSKPSDVVEPCRFLPRITNNTAVTNTTDSVMKLSTDIKQELSIDPRLSGLDGVDEMSINYIASKPSFISMITWTIGDPVDTLLYTSYVTPLQFIKTVLPTNYYVTAMCGCALPFEFWTGSIKFKFYVISSAFHRGRIAITYDPLFFTDREDNVAYTKIVDIAETREFEIVVGNYQPNQWLPIPNTWTTSTPFQFSPYSGLTADANGTISVHVLNELTCPDISITPAPSISMMVFVSAGDDFRVANPSGRTYTHSIAAQSGTEVADRLSDPGDTTTSENVNPLKNRDLLNYMGEEVDSFRTLCKRTNAYGKVWCYGSYAYWQLAHQAYPLFRGRIDNFPYAGTNLCSNTMLNYVMSAFAGWRGGVRWKFLTTTQAGNKNGVLTINRLPDQPIDYVLNPVAWSSFGSDSSNFATIAGPGSLSGSVYTDLSINSCIDVEIPFYSNYKFVPGRPVNRSTQYEDYFTGGFEIVHERPDTSNIYSDCVRMYVSAAEDFTTFFFVGWPPFSIT